MRATITIDLDNDDAQTVARFAVRDPQQVVRYITRCTITSSGAIIDGNGNRIGTVEVEP